MTKSKRVKKADKPRNKTVISKDCPCGLWIDSTAAQCEKCSEWWHVNCANLKGLTDTEINKMEDWLCPKCWVSPHVKRDLSPENCKSMVGMIENEVSRLMPALAAKVREELLTTVRAEVDSSVTETIKTSQEKVENAIKEMSQQDGKMWSSLLKENTDRIDEIKTTVKKTVEDQKSELVEEALLKSQLITDNNNAERERRKRNVVIKDIKESGFLNSEKRIAEDFKLVWDVVGHIVVDREDILKVTRVGPRPRTEDAKPRPVIVEMVTPHLASELCKYGSGRKIYIEESKREYWVNADRIQADREADYRARVLARKQKSERESKAKAAEEARANLLDSRCMPKLVKAKAKTTEDTPVDSEPDPQEPAPKEPPAQEPAPEPVPVPEEPATSSSTETSVSDITSF